MKITIVAGARPNFMKIAPITRAIDAARAQGRSISYRLVYTGKREDTSLDASLFADLHMKEPDVFLEVTDSNATQLASGIMVAFDKEPDRESGPYRPCGRRSHSDNELRHRCQETRYQGSTPCCRYPFVRHEYA